MDIGCMCKDDDYVLAGLCCVSDSCGAYGLSLAKNYVEDYCEEWSEDPPEMEDLTCATVTTTQSTSSTTTTTTTTSMEETQTGTSRPTEESGTPDSGGGNNVGMIAGIAGGVVAIILIIGVALFFWWRRRTNKKLLAIQPQVSTTTDTSKLTESTEMPELQSTPATSVPSLPPRSQAGYQGYYSNMSTPPAYASHPDNTSDYYSMGSELGTDGARPHGSELHGRPVLPPRPELQGMSFATRNPFPAELASDYPKYG